MIWLTWRQFRTQVVTVFAVAVLLTAVLVVTGPNLHDLYQIDRKGFLARINIEKIDQILYVFGIAAVYAAPPVIGAFWGAPMIARELETGTHRLIWNQSITRTHWLAIKLGLTALAAVAVTGLLSLTLTWWSDPIDRAINGGASAGPFSLPRLYPPIFGARGVVPIGYTIFALALGVTLGLVLRRTVPALAVTLAVVVVLEVAMPFAVRAHLITPARHTIVITGENRRGLMINGDPKSDVPGTVRELTVNSGAPGDWVTSNRTINAAGQVQDFLPSWVADCGGPPPGQGTASANAQYRAAEQACYARLNTLGYRQLVISQPAGRFWALQWRETALFVVLGLLLTGFCFWRIRRDLS